MRNNIDNDGDSIAGILILVVFTLAIIWYNIQMVNKYGIEYFSPKFRIYAKDK